MQAHSQRFRVVTMCRVLKVKRSGYYAWLKQPLELPFAARSGRWLATI